MSEKKRVLILCTGNSARSQMAEGLLRHEAGDRFEVVSAGVERTYVRPEAVEAMREIGVDISQHRSKSVDEFAGQEFDYVITVCDKLTKIVRSFPVRRSGYIGALTIRPLPKVTRTPSSTFSGGYVTKFATDSGCLLPRLRKP